MRGRIAVACGVTALTLLGFFTVPGHTWLQSDTQIYAPMLERIWDPSSFNGDIVAAKPHLGYTLYDEIAIALRWMSHTNFEAVLVFQQLVFRALQILGIYLLATSLPLSRGMALLVAALSSFGAIIYGPSVLTIEYEPIPRGYAIGLVMLAIGLAARQRWVLAGASAALALLYHAPTTYPFWIVFVFVVVRGRNFKPLVPAAAAIVILVVASRLQAGTTETQAFFFRIDPEFERIQRLRASYNWVSIWWSGLIWQHLLYWVISLLAFWRIRPRAAREFLLGMPLIGLLSLPVSYILLEKLKWGLLPQLQLARALLFVTEFAIILAAAAGILAAGRGRVLEAFAWLSFVFTVPMQGRLQDLKPVQILLAGTLALCVAGIPQLVKQRWILPVAATIVSAYFLLPTLGQVHNYAHLDNSAIDDLARFARTNTSKNSVFLFADAGTAAYPSVFRVLAQRPVYVDWKSGGQVNYYRSLAAEWWSRWQATHALQFNAGEWDSFARLGIDYIVLTHAVPDRSPLYRNSVFIVYGLTSNR